LRTFVKNRLKNSNQIANRGGISNLTNRGGKNDLEKIKKLKLLNPYC
jgi:hypothetical protein